MTSPTRTLVVHCPDWPVVAAGFDPRADPVVVLVGHEVVACSAAAREAGVHPGLRRREAQGRCPEATVVAGDATRDARAFEPVVAAVEAFVPAVEVLRPGECAFATRGPSRYFGGDEALARRVVTAVAAAGVEARAGIAEGLFAATLAARRGEVVAPGTAAAFLAPMPVRALGPSHARLVDLLVRLGIRTLGDLAALPAADVLARFGPDGAAAHTVARGDDAQRPAPRTPPPDLTVTAELDPPVDRVDAAAFVGKALADELGARLVALGLACARVRVEAETEHGESLVRLWRHDGALTPAAIAERVRWQLDGWLTNGNARDRPSAGIVLVRLVPDEVHADTGRQPGFWGGATAADERAARALARVQGLIGPEGVVTAVPGGGRSPADRVRFVPWGDPREPTRPPDGVPLAGPTRREAPVWPGGVPRPSPAVVHTEPLSAAVVDRTGAPVGVTGRGVATGEPARLAVAGRPAVDVVAWAGPWPCDERWWDPAAHRRRARWQLATADGAAHLLAVEGGTWHVEATYD